MPGFQYSVEVDPASVKSFSCLTSLPIRINVRNQLADELCHQFLKDIQEVIGSSIYSPCLSLSPVGNCVALFVPECLPEFLQPMVNVLNLVWFVDGTNPGAFFSRVRLPVVHAHILKDSIEYAQTRAEVSLNFTTSWFKLTWRRKLVSLKLSRTSFLCFHIQRSDLSVQSQNTCKF